jgi:membrane protein YqaA with SNARE-associated domain
VVKSALIGLVLTANSSSGIGAFVRRIALGLMSMGGFGLLLLGIVDSSILFLPLGNDLLMIAMTARNPDKMLYYAAMATIGSVIGIYIVDAVSRKGGEKGLQSKLPRHRLDYLKKKIEQRASWVIALASILPPPFPFTAAIVAASALQYPRKKLLGITAAARFARFTTEGILAIVFGQRILDLADARWVEWVVLTLVVIATVGSMFSVIRWVRRSKSAPEANLRGAAS